MPSKSKKEAEAWLLEGPAEPGSVLAWDRSPDPSVQPKHSAAAARAKLRR
jgi:hypothetical protein